MFGKPSSSLDSIIYFNEPRETNQMSSFLQSGSVPSTKACRRTRSRLGKINSTFHPYCSGSINEYQACLGTKTLGVSLQTDHLIGTSAHAPQRPMVSSCDPNDISQEDGSRKQDELSFRNSLYVVMDSTRKGIIPNGTLKIDRGYVKSLVYANKPQTLDHLKDNIRRVIADIRPQMLGKVIENWTSRLDCIRASRGSHMPEVIFKIEEKSRAFNPKNLGGTVKYGGESVLVGEGAYSKGVPKLDDKRPRSERWRHICSGGDPPCSWWKNLGAEGQRLTNCTTQPEHLNVIRNKSLLEKSFNVCGIRNEI
ncbi:hypothetical protein TNCV_2271031 [Trichonephila clavipes]|nr:hypothetical protein TNCV_2271031 [Trichonephila clavipes]